MHTRFIIYSKYKAGIGNQPDVSMALAMIDKEKKKLVKKKTKSKRS